MSPFLWATEESLEEKEETKNMWGQANIEGKEERWAGRDLWGKTDRTENR